VDGRYRYARNPDDARYWADARTLRDLGELTARWLEGAIDYQPAWEAARPDAETEALVPVLAALNRGGLVTHFSQPGRTTRPDGMQRAVVSGFCAEDLVGLLQDATLATDLVLLAYPPGGGLDGLQIPVGTSKGSACTWAGAEVGPERIAEYYGPDCHPDALAALRGAWQTTLIDPHWGRDDLLWDRLLAAVAHSGEQAPPDA
jgi:hypothetical protein